MNFCKVFFSLFLIMSFLIPAQAVADNSNILDESQIQELLAGMPDAVIDPEAYHDWKIRYARTMQGDSPDHPHGYSFEALDAMGPMDWRPENGYVAADVDETSGEFDEGGDPGGGGGYVKLTYSRTGSPGTESVMYYDDGSAEKTDGGLPNTSSNYISGNTAYSIWNNWNGVYIRQEISAVRLGAVPGENEQIKFKAVMKPADGSCHNCGCIVYYDTMLDWNDAAEISTAFGYTGIAEIFYAPDIPPIWRAYENGFPPAGGDIVALGILLGFEAVMPDVFWYGSWPSSVGNGWNDADWISDTGGGFGDSATMVKWYPRNICPGDSVIFITYYGIGDITGTDLMLSITCPTLTSDCVGISPNPFDISAVITNGRTATATNVNVSLSLPAGLTLVGGDPNPTSFASIAGYGGTQLVNWQVLIDPSLYGTSGVCYDVTVRYNEGSPITEECCFNGPSIGEIIAPMVEASDTFLCLDETAVLTAHVDTIGGEPCVDYFENFDGTPPFGYWITYYDPPGVQW